MLIEWSNGNKKCNSHAEITETLNHRNQYNENGFWISLNTKFPCIAILVRDNKAAVNYFSEEGHAGFQAVDNTNASKEDIQIFIGGNEYSIEAEAMIPFDEVVDAVLQFYDTQTMPNNLIWDEL